MFEQGRVADCHVLPFRSPVDSKLLCVEHFQRYQTHMLLELLCELHSKVIQGSVVCDRLHYSLGSLGVLLCHGLC